MPQLKILNKKEIKQILNSIEKQWGAKPKLDYGFLKKNDRVFLIDRDISKIELSKLRINSIGLYFCEIYDGVRLSIEGSQIVGREATKNIAEIDDEQAKKWLKGEDLELKGSYSGFVILRNKDDIFGNGKYKNGNILNFVGKERRINAI